jgi:hypothetical protein
MAATAGLGLELTAAAKGWLLDQNTQPEFGARPIRRIVQDFVQDPIVDGLTDGEFVTGDTLRADAPPPEGEGLVFARVAGEEIPTPPPTAEEAPTITPAGATVSTDGDAEATPPGRVTSDSQG